MSPRGASSSHRVAPHSLTRSNLKCALSRKQCRCHCLARHHRPRAAAARSVELMRPPPPHLHQRKREELTLGSYAAADRCVITLPHASHPPTSLPFHSRSPDTPTSLPPAHVPAATLHKVLAFTSEPVVDGADPPITFAGCGGLDDDGAARAVIAAAVAVREESRLLDGGAGTLRKDM